MKTIQEMAAIAELTLISDGLNVYEVYKGDYMMYSGNDLSMQLFLRGYCAAYNIDVCGKI